MVKAQVIRIVYSSARLQMKQSFSRSMFKFIMIVSPIFAGLLLGFVYRNRTAEEFTAYAMIGTAAMTMWSTISFSSAGDINRERFMGALQQIFNSPQDFYNIMLGKVLGNTALGLISMLGSFFFVGLVFHRSIHIEAPLAFLGVFAIMSVSYIMVAMMLSAALAVSRQTRMLMNCMDYPVFILTGCIFPLNILPVQIQWMGYLLSPTYAIKMLRMCIWGQTWTSEFLWHLVGLMITTLVYYVFSRKLYAHIDVKARREATLEVM